MKACRVKRQSSTHSYPGKNYCSHCTKVWVSGLRHYYQLMVNSLYLWQLMFWLYWFVLWLLKDMVSFYHPKYINKLRVCLSVHPRFNCRLNIAIESSNTMSILIWIRNTSVWIWTYNAIWLVYAKFGVNGIPFEVIKPAMMIVRTLEMNDGGRMWICTLENILLFCVAFYI